MERGGASAVIAEGMESGGHIGAQTTMTLVPQVVKNILVERVDSIEPTLAHAIPEIS